jgi:ubiquinone/menaquinone biosynthesis C-methylase UbiE
MIETEITSATYDQIAADYAARWASTEALAPERARFAALLRPGARVLDIGCGPGRDTVHLRELGLRASGLDRSRGMLAEARGRGLPLVLGDMRALPVRAGALDGLWACASFLHIPKSDGPAVLREFQRGLRPGGILYIAVKEGADERWVEYSPGQRRFFVFYNTGELDKLLIANGFSIVDGWVNKDSRGRPEGWINRLARSLLYSGIG